MDSDEDGQAYLRTVREHQQRVARLSVAQYMKLIRDSGRTPAIDLLDEPEIDEYGTVTLGSWANYLVQIMPMIFNDRIVLTPAATPMFIDYGWCYDKGGAAYLAAAIWDPAIEGEPKGYKKRVAGIRQPGERASGHSLFQ